MKLKTLTSCYQINASITHRSSSSSFKFWLLLHRLHSFHTDCLHVFSLSIGGFADSTVVSCFSWISITSILFKRTRLMLLFLCVDASFYVGCCCWIKPLWVVIDTSAKCSQHADTLDPESTWSKYAPENLLIINIIIKEAHRCVIDRSSSDCISSTASAES